MSEGTTLTEPGAEIDAGSSFERWLDGRTEPELLATRRREAWAEWLAEEMPTRRSEEWRYTDLRDLNPESYAPVGEGVERARSREDLPSSVREVLDGDQKRSAVLVRHNGAVEHLRVDEELTRLGVVYGPIEEIAASRPELIEEFLFRSDVAAHERKLWALHGAMLSGGYILYVPRNVALPHPVHALRYMDEEGALLSTHSLIIAERGAEITCIDEYLSPDLAAGSLSLNGVEIFGSENAVVRYLSLQHFGAGVRHFSMQHVNTGRDSTLNVCNVTLGADLSRCDVSSHLLGPGSDSEMLALWFGDRSQHFDHHTLQNHAAPHARSDLLFKGALAGEAKSVFRGMIRVAKDAQLTDAYQTNRNLMLSEDAEAVTLPSLEIEADDVKCSHGATIGQVDEAQLFYLMSRGLTRGDAERLLVLGFFDEVLGRVPLEGVRDRVRAAIERKIGLAT
ncbi:MAG: Fe-S cluster assembly protein SufD [marine benthic group bacterium]|nr:Fe-S cluster assembly protein SufD [Gemmatimonadota bacterium]MCL7961811.1 Fe-S cluster assembly protein SufD [Candidatus Carthagonibacter metallireducens]MCL7937642.1 Fe-S cluster assembly protein SufD [Gemmatimonadota bacterium]MCL7957643.1 Fe-S cluster assembly protein SufD [Gemmatimonadota bacterium]MCL7964829.1 Fe-S cluster assembly protein SufD [Gemmatimonadota bacterium]